MSNQDRRFFETFGIVLGAIILFTVIIYFVANHIAGGSQVQWSNAERESAAEAVERTRPVGQVAVAGETPAATTAASTEPAAAATVASAAPAPAAAVSGEDIYNSMCFACHATGAAGAPKLGDKADWGPRIAKGTDTLVQHAISGFQGEKGIMPPKGGRADFSDESVKAAVEYMVSKAQ